MDLSDYAKKTEAERWEFRLNLAFALMRARGLKIVDRAGEAATRKARASAIGEKTRAPTVAKVAPKMKTRAAGPTKPGTPRTARKKS